MIPLERQREALEQGALVRIAPELGSILVRGSERRTWLNGLVTSDLANLHSGEARYGLFVQKNGKILAEAFVASEPDRLIVGVRLDRLELVYQHLERYLIMEDAELDRANDEARSWALVLGPRSLDVAQSTETLRAFGCNWTGFGGAVLVADSVVRFSEAVERAARTGVLVERATEEAMASLRIEKGLPLWGVDFDSENYPQEASLESRAVSFQKGCYLGQETVFMLHARGHVSKKLVKIAIEGTSPLPERASIFLPEGDTVGIVTSAAEVPSGFLALGYVKYKHASVGTSLWIADREARIIDTLT